jgi:tetratricopeptide (TPR) repeat protein
LAAYPSHELGFLKDLGEQSTVCSALANQLGDWALALQQGDLARRVIEIRMRIAPDDVRQGNALSGAWERVAKAHWSLGDRAQALADFRQSAACQRLLFERDPSIAKWRNALSQCYSRLVFYASQSGELNTAADAILERVKLWPNDRKQLAQAAEDFQTLADQVSARGAGHPSGQDLVERDRYLAESRRLKQAADAAGAQANLGARGEH